MYPNPPAPRPGKIGYPEEMSEMPGQIAFPRCDDETRNPRPAIQALGRHVDIRAHPGLGPQARVSSRSGETCRRVKG